MISVPQTLEIELVDSSVLNDYEVWFAQSSILFSALMSIVVAMIQSGGISFSLGICGVVFLVLLVISSIFGYKKRKQLKRKAKSIPFVPK